MTGGVAVIQTFSPRNEIISLACRQDYESFYEGEIAIRRELCYPPFCDMVSLTVTSDSESELRDAAQRLSNMMIEKINAKYSDCPFIVFGPFEAQVYKVNERSRMRMVVKCKLTAESRRMFGEVLAEFSQNRAVSLSIDLNPLTV